MSSNNEKNDLLPTIGERVFNGLVKENPTFVLLLGMCPTLAVTTSAINGLGMGATTLVVLALSNLMISALRKIIPDKIRIPAFIVIIASFVTIVELLLNAYIHSLYDALGLYIPLIVVNCIILGRAEAYAYSNPVLPSFFDGVGMGLGFTVALTLIGSFREILGAGEIFGFHIMPSGYTPISIFVMAPGAFFVLAMLTAIQNAVKIAGTKRGKDMSKIQSGCGGNCMECSKECKVSLEPDNKENDDALETSEVIESESEAVKSATSKKSKVKSEDETKSETESESVSESEMVSESDVEKESESSKTSEPKAKRSSKKKAAKSETSECEIVESEAIKSEFTESEIIETSEVSEIESASQLEIKTESETAEESTSERVSESEALSETSSGDDDGDLVLLDLSDYKRAIHKTTAKSGRKKTSRAKAKDLLSKADENMREDKK